MGYLAGHQKVQRLEHIRILGKLHQVFVNDLGARLGSDVRTQIDRQIAVRIDVRALPGYAVAVGEARTASGQHAELRIQRRLMDKFLPIALAAEHPGKIGPVGRVLQLAVDSRQQHLNRSPDDLQMSQFLGRDIHQHIVLVGIGIPAREGLNEILHGGFQLSVTSAELLEQQAGKARIGLRNARIELKFFDMMKHKLYF